MKFEIEKFNEITKAYNENKFDILANDEETRAFYDVILRAGLIELTQKGAIKKRDQSEVYVGRLSLKQKFGFVISTEDIYIHNTKGYLESDIVVCVVNQKQRGRTKEGQIIDYLYRPSTTVLVEVKRDKNMIILDDKYKSYNISLNDKKEYDYFNERQIILLDIVKVKNQVFICKFNKVVADANDPDLKMKITLATFGIETEFSEAALEQVETIDEVAESDLKGRVDLRNEVVMTIDGADSKDLDDAITLYKLGEDYRLIVSIADVSHYITAGSPLDVDAYSRSTSVYFVDRVVPMIPKKLSNGICSLHPNVDRLTITCDMTINKYGDVIEHKIYPSVINSKYRLTYDQVNDVLDGKQVDGIEALNGTIFEMNKLHKILNKKRIKRGSFNLEDKDAKFKVDEDGNIIDIMPFVRRNAEKIIEEFMIIANETVATDIYERQLPFIYRVHDHPNPKKLSDVLSIFSLMGIRIEADVFEFQPLMFKQILDQLEDDVQKRIVSDLIVRSLSKARYQRQNTGHFGLASTCYTHFTSPIRRYPDLIVHRNLRKYIFEENQTYNEGDVDHLDAIGIQTSQKEVSAIKAEQQIEDQRKAKYMNQFVGQEFEGVVASILEFGFFIELDNTVRGLIKFGSIKEFTKSVNHKLHFSDGKVLTLGDRVPVKLIETNENKGLVEFELLGYTRVERSYTKRSDKDKRGAKKTGDKRGSKSSAQGGSRCRSDDGKPASKNRKNKKYRNAKGKRR